MLHHEGNEGKPGWARWHEFRAEARRDAFSPDEFSDIERTKFDLNDDDPRSAGITGEDNPESYIGDDTTVGEQPDVDARAMPWR